MIRTIFPQRYFSIADVVILLLIATAIYALVAIGHEWQADYHPLTEIDLSVWALPRYVLLSAMRGIAAYFISLTFTLMVGYLAAKSARAERFIIPLLDILQSIPVLGFLPGLVLGLVALFPRTNVGLELAAILMIFTGQVWNMTFSFYSSLKSLPADFQEASTVIGLNWKEKLTRVELPFAAVNLTWNSLMSMAGGWFFLTVCEAFTLGDQKFRLPGIGSYMATAVDQGNSHAMIAGVLAMVLLIVTMDFVIWRPILAWVQRFRLEDVPGAAPPEPLMRLLIRESYIVRWLRVKYRHYIIERLEDGPGSKVLAAESVSENPPLKPLPPPRVIRNHLTALFRSRRFTRTLEFIVLAIGAGVVAVSVWKLIQTLSLLPWTTWMVLVRNGFWTFNRVFIAIILSSLWTVPFGIWIGTSSRRIRVAQPIIQVLASFPAPMLYPLVLGVLFHVRMSFDWASMFLMMLGVQWYILFNVLAGALRIPMELNYALELMEASHWDRWMKLYIPSVFPALATGWVTAAGGAWNASIVAEYLSYKGATLETGGLGATISVAAASQNFPVLAASLSLMVLIVILLNRAVWARVYQLAQTRYRMDL